MLSAPVLLACAAYGATPEWKVNWAGKTSLPTGHGLAAGFPADAGLKSHEKVIFADGFESGDFSAWSSATTGGGDLSVSAAAALVGTRGMQALINDKTAIFVSDDTPDAVSRYRARFSFDPNSIAMAKNNAHVIFDGRNAGGTVVVRIEFRQVVINHPIPGSPFGIYIDGTTAYISTDEPAILILDVADPFSPVEEILIKPPDR